MTVESGQAFAHAGDIPWQDLGGGVRRRILCWDDALMMVEVAFEAGAVGALHSHPHRQASLVRSGRFRLVIDGATRDLGPGDVYFVRPDLPHEALALEAGVLLDVFTPARQDFL
ncbi:cupin domain-containing protein [Prosthecomicrobium sp. N25]|uniref:cupin domain-containing protein n=1 Tax=Prosthecomicrobium sp. N25 TaxID=3129254 RepID=UPI003077310A